MRGREIQSELMDKNRFFSRTENGHDLDNRMFDLLKPR